MEPLDPLDLGDEKEKHVQNADTEDLKLADEIPHMLNILEKSVIMLESGSICEECLGRQFSFLGTGTDNKTRAESILLSLIMEIHAALLKSNVSQKYTLFGKNPLNILKQVAERTEFGPAVKLYKKWIQENPTNSLELNPQENLNQQLTLSHDKCILCSNLLSTSSIHSIVTDIITQTKGYEFENFLIGSQLDPLITEREEEFRARFGVKNGETFKANLNRLIGKRLKEILLKPSQFEKPDITITLECHKHDNQIGVDLSFFTYSLFVGGTYLKFSRDLPQTRWYCFRCRGHKILKTGLKCPECQGTGLAYPDSIQDLVGNEILANTKGIDHVFHGAGREDRDARCLGSGRKFIIEIKQPHYRHIDLQKITQNVNQKHIRQLFIKDLDFVQKEDVINLKKQSEETKKKYHALVVFQEPITASEFEMKLKRLLEIQNSEIDQRTPLRVVHRRADMTRKKKIFTIEGKFVDPVHGFFKIHAEAGTYIKELISGDHYRTSPSFSQIFGMQCQCVELDVVNIQPIQQETQITRKKEDPLEKL